MAVRSRGLRDELCDALRVYAALLAERAARPEAVAGMDLVREAAGRFVEASITETGWGNPFNPPEHEDEDEDDSPATPTAASSGTVDVSINYRISCLNMYLARQAVLRRLREVGQSSDPNEIDTLVDIVETLVSIDRWDPERYNQYSRSQVFEVLTIRGSVGPAS